jgi:hypothetical protein
MTTGTLPRIKRQQVKSRSQQRQDGADESAVVLVLMSLADASYKLFDVKGNQAKVGELRQQMRAIQSELRTLYPRAFERSGLGGI